MVQASSPRWLLHRDARLFRIARLPWIPARYRKHAQDCVLVNTNQLAWLAEIGPGYVATAKTWVDEGVISSLVLEMNGPMSYEELLN